MSIQVVIALPCICCDDSGPLFKRTTFDGLVAKIL